MRFPPSKIINLKTVTGNPPAKKTNRFFCALIGDHRMAMSVVGDAPLPNDVELTL